MAKYYKDLGDSPMSSNFKCYFEKNYLKKK